MTGRRFLSSVIAGILGATCAALMTIGPLAAQTVDVTFKAKTGDLTVSGLFKDLVDEAYLLSTQAGDITLVPSDVTCTSRACPVMGPLPRQKVPDQMRRISPKSLDRQIEIEGELLGVSDEQWLIAVPGLGALSFERRGLRCSGPGCLVTAAMIVPVAPIAKPLQIVGPHDLTEGMLAVLLKNYAADVAPQAEMRRLS